MSTPHAPPADDRLYRRFDEMLMSVAEPIEDGMTATEEPDSLAEELDELDIDDVEESLIEEISIDGMCGVY